MSQHLSPQNVPLAQQPLHYPQQENQQQQVTIAQPTVRVMRLYKPCMHVIPTFPPTIESSTSKTADFAVSPFLLLPDSFGDIYTGELFSAYIAVVNGNQDNVLNQVTLSVRLQTANSSHDLLDCRPTIGEISGSSKILNPNAAVDVVVKYTLTELGTHTLRVSVQYSSRFSSEAKTLRKFYRFNVLQPLQIVSSGIDLGDKILVQSLISNTTKSPLFIEEMNFHAAQKNVTVTSISPPKNKTDLTVFDSLDHFNLDSLPLLLPEESYAAVFHVSKEIGTCLKVVGNPEIKWCTYMGEHGLVTGSEVVLTSSTMISTNASQQQQEIEDMIYIDCISSPLTVYKGKEFEIILRVTNNKNKSTMMQLICKDMVASSYSNSIDQIIPIRDQTLNTKKDINTPPGQGDNLKILNDKNGSQLFVTGSSKKNLGEIRNGEFVDISVKVCAVDFGLQELKGVSVIDKNTSKEYTSKSLVKVMVISDQPQN